MRILIILAIFLINALLFPQEKYLVFFRDKGEQDNKYFKQSLIEQKLFQIFSKKSIERRRKVFGDKVFSYGDYPIYEPYIRVLENNGIKIINNLNWFNAISCYLTKEQLELVKNFSFVEKVEKVKVFKSRNSKLFIENNAALEKFYADYGPSFFQLNLSGIPSVHSKGITGQNVIIGLLDSGFRWKSHEAIKNTDVIAEYDFVFQDSITSNELNDTPSQDIHGTMILGIVAGNMEGKLYGSSYNSKFILAKTEDIRSETRVEEDNYAAALEWMERLGVDVTSSSLGYSEFDDPNESYTYKDMNGNTTLVARAVDSAFIRGVVTITAAGNEFSTPWRYIVSPADAKYVISVGAVHPDGSITMFSSRGPTSDGRIKPDVCAQGSSVYTVQAGTFSNYTFASGTSASTPIVSGIASLLISHYPEINQYQVRDAIRNTASQSEKPDTIYGWGIANAKKALSYPLLIKNENVHRLYKSLFIDSPIDSVRLIILTNYDQIQLFNEKMNSSSQIKFYSDLPSSLRSDDVYKFYFIYYSNGNRLREPENDGMYYTFQISSLKVFPPKKSITQISYFHLEQNYPNPFSEITKFRFQIPVQDWITFEIYDVLGRKIKTIAKDVSVSRGEHNWLQWDGTDEYGNIVSSGIYFYRFKSVSIDQTKKLIFLRK